MSDFSHSNVSIIRRVIEAVITGKQVKTITYRFYAAIPPKARSLPSRVRLGERKRLCDGGGHES